MKKIIKIVPYNPDWPNIFTVEAEFIKRALGDNCLEIYHIGSTSVPGLAAKPKIDVIVVVKNSSSAIKSMQEIGVKYQGEYNIPMHHLFTKRGLIDFNIHLYEQDHPEIELNLVFRDYLRANKKAREAYEQLKYNLLKDELAHQKIHPIFTNYTLFKGDFIRNFLKKAGFNRLRIHKCLDQTEWEAAKQLRDKYFFTPQNVVDPYLWSFNHPKHAHLILYQGVDIIGYAHLQFWPENRAAMRIIVIDEKERSKGKGSEFLALIEQMAEKFKYKKYSGRI